MENAISTRRHIAWSAIGNLIVPFAALVSAPVLARGLGPDDRGAVAAIVAVVFMGVGLLGLGLPEVTTYQVARKPTIVRIIWLRRTLISVAIGAIGIGAVIAFLPILAPDSPGSRKILALAALSLPVLLAINFWRGTLAGLHRWRRINVERVSQALIKLLAIVALFSVGHLSVETAVLVIVGVPVGTGLLLAIASRRRIPKQEPLHSEEERRGASGTVSYALAAWAGSLSGIILLRVDQVLMVGLTTTEELGLYAVAVSIGEVAQLPAVAVRDVMTSRDAQNSSNSRAALALRTATIATLALVITASCALPFVLPLLFGASFSDAQNATYVLLLSAVLWTPGSVAGAILVARGEPWARAVVLSLAAVVNVCAVLLLAPPFGATGAAAATAVSSLSGSILCIGLLRRRHQFKLTDLLRPKISDFSQFVDLVRRRR